MKKEKTYSVIIMVVSVLILLYMMYLGKMMGRDISSQQASLKEKFPAINMKSEADIVLENLSPEELQRLSNQSIRILTLVAVASVSVMTVLLVARKFAVLH